MNSDDREDIRISFRDLDRAPAARDRCSDGEDAGDTSFSRASQDVAEVRREIGVIEVGVGFD
jgi:hypothetical protein